MNQQATEYTAELQRLGPVKWAEGPNGWTGEDGKPITLTPWQRAALGAWWKHRRDTSTFAVSNVKKTGKTFVTAVLTCYRWLGMPGQHFAAGNDLDQAQARQFSMIAEMVRRNPFLSENVKGGKSELEFTLTSSRLTALAADATGNAGANFQTASHTEVWGVQYENSIRSFEELSPVPGKFYGLPCLRVCDSYAGFEGESKVWHSIVDRGIKGELVSKTWPIYLEGGLMLFHMTGQEARERCYRGSKTEAEIYYKEQAASLRLNSFTRMHSNERTAAESAFLPEGAWAACFDPSLRPLAPGDHIRLCLGGDASTSRDFTSLVGTIYNEETNTVDVKYCKVWRPRRIAGIRMGKPTIDIEATIGAEVLRLHEAGQVGEVFCDNFQLHTSVITWHKAGIKVTELPQTSGRVESDQGLYDGISARSVRHYNDPELNEAVKNAVALETPRGFRLAKEKTSKKIDAAVALSMSHYGSLKEKGQGGGFDVIPLPRGWFGNDDWVEEGDLSQASIPELLKMQREARESGETIGIYPPPKDGQSFEDWFIENTPEGQRLLKQEAERRGIITDPEKQRVLDTFYKSFKQDKEKK